MFAPDHGGLTLRRANSVHPAIRATSGLQRAPLQLACTLSRPVSLSVRPDQRVSGRCHGRMNSSHLDPSASLTALLSCAALCKLR